MQGQGNITSKRASFTCSLMSWLGNDSVCYEIAMPLGGTTARWFVPQKVNETHKKMDSNCVL